MILGKHIIVELRTEANLTDIKYLSALLIEAAKNANANILYNTFHEFEGGGVTGVLVLSESHLSVHTWPEHKYMALDIFMCGKSRPALALDVIIDKLRPFDVKMETLYRGF